MLLPLSAEPLALQRFRSSVYRRYNDFVVFHELLLQKFPYRMVPGLPPKRMLGGTAGPGGGGRWGVGCPRVLCSVVHSWLSPPARYPPPTVPGHSRAFCLVTDCGEVPVVKGEGADPSAPSWLEPGRAGAPGRTQNAAVPPALARPGGLTPPLPQH